MNNLKDYQYLVAVAQTLHFGQASKQCFVSQPTLSGQIKKMEQQLGFLLFERNNRKVIITNKGKVMVEAAQQIINAQKIFQQKAKQLSAPDTGEIHLGLIPTLAPYLLPLIMPKLHAKFNQLQFFLYEEKTEKLLNDLNLGKVDALILPWLPEMKNYHSIDLFDEPLLLALPKHHRLAKVKKLALSDLDNEQILTLQDGHCLKDQTQSYCFSSSEKTDKRFDATSLETLRYMIASGTGVTLIPKLATLNRQDKDIVYREIEIDKPTRKIVMLTRTISSDNQSLLKIAELIKSTVV